MNLVQLCDEIAEDVEANVDLPDHRTLKYVEHRAVGSEIAPCLLVYPDTTRYQMVLTDDVQVIQAPMTVAWAEDAVYGATTGGVGDQELAKAALQRAQAISAQLREYVVGFEAPLDDYYGVPDRASMGLTEGNVWRVDFTLNVERFT